MDFMTMIIIGGVIGVVSVIERAMNKNNNQKAIKNRIDKIPNFTISNILMGTTGENAIVIDENKAKICLAKKESSNISIKIYNFRDILEVEILEDGSSLTKTSRSSQVGGMLIGGLALGGVGAIIGGLSGKTNTVDKVSNIDLKIIVNDIKTPMHLIKILQLSDGVKKDAMTYKTSIANARQWSSLITVLINKADKEDANKKVESNGTKSLSQELLNLSKLKEDGILTDEEYRTAKMKVISSIN